LPPNPTGHADLLKIVGKRNEDSPEVSPTTWIFYFYDKSAAGHARIITVNNRQIVKMGEDLADSLSPFEEQDILPEDKLTTDSTQALAIGEGLVPGVTITSSEFTLQQPRHSVPMWKATLWGKNQDGDEHKLGDVTILVENGIPISKNLRQ